MYIMKKMNREKKAANESERNALIQKGYVQVGKTTENGISVQEDADKSVEKMEEVTDTSSEEKTEEVADVSQEEETSSLKEEKKGTKKKV